MDNIPDGIYFKDRESHFTQINLALARHLGLSDPAEATGKTDFDFFSKEHAQQACEDEQAIVRTGEPLVGKEEKETWSDGRIAWASTTKMLLRSQEGRIVGTFGISRDITGRKRAERQLAETLDFNQRIISDAPAGIVVYKASGQCVLVNEFAARTINATIPQLLKQNFRQLENWRVSGMLGIAEEVLVTGKPQQCESHFVSTFGKEVWLVCNFNPFVLGDKPHLLLVFNDITSRKRAEEHIREQAALLDKAQDAIFVLDLDDRIIYWNKSAERIYGWTAAEAVGKSAVELLFKGVVTPQLANTIKTVNERGEWVGESQEYTKDGRTVTVQGRCNLIRDEQGRPKSRLIINTDITEKKKLEIQFLRSQRMEGIGALAGGIVHDLNNILTPLLISVQMLKEKVTDEDGRKLLRALEANVHRGAGLVKQVLVFGRGVTGERIPVHLEHIAREIKQFVHETFPKALEFEFHTAADLWTITGDPTQLHQVLLNLCINARDAMPKGGKLSILTENMMFDETYAGMNPEAKAGPYVCIMVTDTGTGIPREIQDKIFDPFFTTKEPGKGTGLGLSTTLAIVKNHGGFIHCHSTPGKGSRFEIYFPANISRGVEENATAEVARLPRGHNELVLVVDDEEQIREIAQKTLERFGYRVLLAADGAEAVSLYASRQQEIGAVITDMVMPIMDGPAAIVALKIINPDVKIVSSSGMASEGGLAKARDAGVWHFIPKPYTAAVMLNTLHEVLNGKR
jgi:PAS domain S-box-containing protein